MKKFMLYKIQLLKFFNKNYLSLIHSLNYQLLPLQTVLIGGVFYIFISIKQLIIINMQKLNNEALQIELDQLTKNLNDMKLDEKLQKQYKDDLKKIQSLNKNSLSMLRSFKNPPPLIFEIVKYLLIIFSPQSQSNWIECQNLLMKANLIELMINLEISNITNEQLESLNQIEKIELKQVQMQSMDAAQICSFLQSVVKIRKTQIYQTKYRINQIKRELAQNVQ